MSVDSESYLRSKTSWFTIFDMSGKEMGKGGTLGKGEQKKEEEVVFIDLLGCV